MISNNINIGDFKLLDENSNKAVLQFKALNDNYDIDYTYIGEINESKEMDGYGKLWSSNYSYHGNFKNNHLDGIGILKYTGPKDDLDDNFVISYKGNFNNNKKNGEGIETYNTKEFYNGTFFNDLRHGKGILFNTNGEVKIDSAWELGRSVNNKNITEYYPNGCLKYRGEYNGFHKHGKGVLCNQKGEIVFDGTFKDGNCVEGKLFKNNFIIFNGKFDDNNKPKEGVFFSENGCKLLCGYVEQINENTFNIISSDENTSVFYSNGRKMFTGKLLNNPNPLIYDFNVGTDAQSKMLQTIILDGNLFCKTLNFQNDEYPNDLYFMTFGTGTIFNSNGMPICKINTTNLKYDKKNIIYSKDHNIFLEYNFNDGKLNGESKEYFESGNIKKITNYENGLMNGELLSYIEQNNESVLCAKIQTVKNVAKHLEAYYPSSKKKYEGDIDNNLKFNGNGTLYYENDNNSINYVGSFTSGKFHGNGVLYHNNGHKAYEGNWDNNRKHGDGMSFYESTGTIEYTGNWVHDERHGEGSLFTENAELVYNGNFHYDDMAFAN